MLIKDIRIGQRVYDYTIDAHYTWVAGHFTNTRNEMIQLTCTACAYPSTVFLKWNDVRQDVQFCVDCADIDALQVVMVSVK